MKLVVASADANSFSISAFLFFSIFLTFFLEKTAQAFDFSSKRFPAIGFKLYQLSDASTCTRIKHRDE